MKRFLIFIAILLPTFGISQNDTVYYFGVNGKINNPVKKDIMKKLDYRGNRKIKVKTYKSTETDWQLIYTEKIKVVKDSVYEIRMKGDEFSGRITRTFETLENGTLKFRDRINSTVKRTGTTKQKVPLIFDGTVTENYNSGKVKIDFGIQRQ